MESNIDAYSVEELTKMFQLSQPLTDYAVNSAMDIYKKSSQNSNIVAQRFIEAASKKLLDSVNIKTRHKSTTFNYDAHSILMHLKEPKKNFTYELESTPDYLNPTFQNTITRIINLDSKFRENSYPLVDAITGKDVTYNFATAPTIKPDNCLEPNKQSSTQYTAYLSDTLTGVLSLKLYNISIPYLWYNIDKIYGNNFFQYSDATTGVVNINRRDLSNINLPTGQYNLTGENNIYSALNAQAKNNNLKLQFELDPLTRKTIISYYSSDYSGNYRKDFLRHAPFTILWYNILNITNENIKSNNNIGWKLGFRREISYLINEDNKDAHGQPALYGTLAYYIDFSNEYSPLGSTIYLDTVEENIFYNKDKTISYDPCGSQPTIYYKKEPVYYSPSFESGTLDVSNISAYDSSMHNSPGNIMRVYSNAPNGTITKRYKYTAMSDAPADLRLTKYLLLSLEDYNNNQLNSGLISIQSTEKNVKIDSKKYGLKISHCPDGQNKNYYQYSTGPSGEVRGITKAQVTAINAVAQLRSRPSNKTIAPTNSIFAIIRIPEDESIKYGDTITNNDITLLNNERKYFGPITIGSLKVKLLTEDGNVLNLNKTDWSFALLCKQLYQY